MDGYGKQPAHFEKFYLVVHACISRFQLEPFAVFVSPLLFLRQDSGAAHLYRFHAISINHILSLCLGALLMMLSTLNNNSAASAALPTTAFFNL